MLPRDYVNCKLCCIEAVVGTSQKCLFLDSSTLENVINADFVKKEPFLKFLKTKKSPSHYPKEKDKNEVHKASSIKSKGSTEVPLILYNTYGERLLAMKTFNVVEKWPFDISFGVWTIDRSIIECMTNIFTVSSRFLESPRIRPFQLNQPIYVDVGDAPTSTGNQRCSTNFLTQTKNPKRIHSNMVLMMNSSKPNSSHHGSDFSPVKRRKTQSLLMIIFLLFKKFQTRPK